MEVVVIRNMMTSKSTTTKSNVKCIKLELNADIVTQIRETGYAGESFEDKVKRLINEHNDKEKIKKESEELKRLGMKIDGAASYDDNNDNEDNTK